MFRQQAQIPGPALQAEHTGVTLPGCGFEDGTVGSPQAGDPVVTQPGADQQARHQGQQQGLAPPCTTSPDRDRCGPEPCRGEHQQGTLLHQHRRQSQGGGETCLAPTTATLGIAPTAQTPEGQGPHRRQRHLQHVVGAQIEEGRGQGGQQAGQQGQALTMQLSPPSRHGQQQQAMPEAQAPGSLGGIITTDGHHRAVHQRRQRRNLGGEIQQGIPALPLPSRQHTQGTTVIHGAVEIISLIPGGQTGLQLPPETIHKRGQQPDQQESAPETPVQPHQISRRRRSSWRRCRRCFASLSISRPSRR